MLLASFFANGVIKKSFYFRHEIKITVLLGIANGVYSLRAISCTIQQGFVSTKFGGIAVSK